MTRSALDQIEDYLLGRCAQLEAMVRDYSKDEVTHTVTRISEVKETLKKVREIKKEKGK